MAPGVTTYHLSPRRRWLLLVIWAALVLPILALGVTTSELALVITGGITGVIVGVFFAVAGLWFPRLVISESGIERHDLGYRLGTSWANVSAVRLTKLSEGLILHEPMSGKGATRLRRAGAPRLGGGSLSLYRGDVRELVAEQRFLPLEAFAYWIDHGALGDDLRRHLPPGVFPPGADGA
jgi:hypothetical protein